MTRLLAQCDTPSRGLILFHHLGVLSRFFPELADSFGVTQNEYHPDDVFMHSVKSCDSAPQDNLAVRWAALLHDLGKVTKRMVIEGENGESDRVVFYQHEEESARIAHHVLTRLRYSAVFVRKVESLVAHHMFLYQPEWRDATVRRFINRVGEGNVEDMFALRVADCMSRGMEEEVIKLEELRERVQKELETRHALSVKDLAIDGADLIRELQIKEGPDVGRILNELFDDVVENPDLNNRETLLELAKKRYR
jgi:poly(A) polymerase/tRNA nucleotidyltransferase (CCA-adding enzyme)